MSRDIQLTQYENASRAVTDPLLLLLWAHSGVQERLSCSSAATLDGQTYTAGAAEVNGLIIGESATVIVPANPERFAQVNNGTYRNQVCKIYSIAADPSKEDEFLLSDAVLALDGIIVSSEFSGGQIKAQIAHKTLTGNLTPRIKLNQLANHIPPAGTVLVSTKQNVELERSR